MRAFLIDFENVKSAGLAGIEDLAPDDHVVILYSVNSNTISFEMHQKILQSKTPIEYFQIRRGGKNSLDFQLSSLLGWLLASGKYSHLFIISNDNGFDALTDFWTSGFVATDAVVRRYHTIGQALSSCRKAEKVRPEVKAPAGETRSPEEPVRKRRPFLGEDLHRLFEDNPEDDFSGEGSGTPLPDEPDEPDEVTQPAEPAPEIDPAVREMVRQQNEQFFRDLGLSEVSAAEPAEPAEHAEHAQPAQPVQPVLPVEEIPVVSAEQPAEAATEEPAEEPEINVINVIDLFTMPSSPKKRKAVVPKPRSERPARKAAPAEEPAVPAEAEPEKVKAEPAPAEETVTEAVTVPAAETEPEKPAEAPEAEPAPAEEAPAARPKKEKPARKKTPKKEKPAPAKEAAPDAKAARVAEALPAALTETVNDAQKMQIAAALASSTGKQEFYREIIGHYGQKRGLEIYKTVKSEYSNLKKLADSQ